MKGIFVSTLILMSAGAHAGFEDEFKEAWRINGGDYGASTATDSVSNLYIAGNKSAGGLFSTSDLTLTKYRADGNEIWTQTFGTPSNDYASAIATDDSGNIYLTGRTYGEFDGLVNTGEYDVFVSKFDAQGNKLWTQQFGTPGDDISRAIATDSDGNTFLTGVIVQSDPKQDGDENPGDDAFISKLSPEGTVLWTHPFGTPAGDGGHSITLDINNNAYIVGRTSGAFDGHANQGDFDIFVSKFTNDGKQVWNHQFGSPAADFANSIATDAQGNINLAGAIDGNLFIARYDELGNQAWLQQDTQAIKPGSGSINMDSDGNAYVGYSYGESCLITDEICSDRGFVSHFHLRKYSVDGAKDWDKRFITSPFINGESVTIDAAQRLSLAVNLSYGGFRYSSEIVRLEPVQAPAVISDRFNPVIALEQSDQTVTGLAGDSEDLNLNGVLDAGEDLNSNTIIDFRSEDKNSDGVLSEDEDENGNGLLDIDTGIARVELNDAVNLSLSVDPFTAGTLQTGFSLSLIDPSIDGTGTLAVSDVAGNRITQTISLTGSGSPIATNECSTAANYSTHAGDGRVEVEHWARSQSDPDTESPKHGMWISGNDNPDLFIEQPWVSYPSWSLYFEAKPGVSGTATIHYSVVDYATGGKEYTCGDESFTITVLAESEEPSTEAQAEEAKKRLLTILGDATPLVDATTFTPSESNKVRGDTGVLTANENTTEPSGGGGMGMLLIFTFIMRVLKVRSSA